MTSKNPDRHEEVKSTITDDDNEVDSTGSTEERDRNTKLKNATLVRRIFEAAMGLNAVDKFTSGDPASALILSTVAVLMWYYGGRR